VIGPRELRKVRVFADLADDDLRWLSDHAEVRTFEPDDMLFVEGDVVDSMVAMLEGEIRVRKEQGPRDANVVVQRAGDISAKRPLSRMTRSLHTVRALAPTRAAFFHEAVFPCSSASRSSNCAWPPPWSTAPGMSHAGTNNARDS
jgi:CRP-like cAMP-binding protein